MYERILVPTDGSEVAAAAVDAAIAFGESFGAELHAVHVLNHPDTRQSRGQRVTDAVAEKGMDAGLEVTTAAVELTDTIHRTILGYADDNGIDCIVAGTHGRTGIRRLLMGSIAELLLRESSVPVITVHEGPAVDPAFDRILVPTDGSDCANAAAEEAIRLAKWTGAAIHVVYVIDIGVAGANVAALLATLQNAGEEAIQTIVDRAREEGIASVESSIVRGIPYWSILGYVDDHDIDCLVMGTHGRTGFERYFLGSVTERVARLADVPVLTIRGPEAPTPAVQIERD